MKTLHIKHIIGGLLFVSSVALFSACSGTDELMDTTEAVSGLKVNLAIGDATLASSKASTRANSDASLNEDKIANLNVMFYNAGTGALAKCYYLDSNDLASGSTKLLSAGSAWTSEIIPGTTYNVYVVANYGSDLSGTALTDVRSMIKTDADIYKQYDASTNPDKLFIMDGLVSGWSVPSGTANVNVPVTLKRAADKILLNISLDGTNLTQTDDAAAWTWKLLNYATNTTVVEGQSYDKTVNAASAENSVTPSNNAATITTYCFDNSWANSISSQTMIEVNIPCKYKGTTYTINKYRLPITTLTTTGRNNIYQITAKLDKLGDTNTEQNFNLSYSVRAWFTHDIDIDDSNVNYLIVSPQEVIMKNVAENNEIKYYSSSAVKVDKIHAFYYDALQNPVDVSSSISDNISATLNGANNGFVTFKSPIPTNLGPRYIELTLSNSNGKSQTVLIKQYPLEYITAIAGSYSYKDGWLSYKNVLDNTIPYKTAKGTYTESLFSSRVYKNGYINDIIFNKDYFRSGWDVDYLYDGTVSYNRKNLGSQKNNYMYVVRITSTSSKYKVDKPTITDGVTDGSVANNNVVSPAFMLASQLGVTSTASWTEASDHCKKYIEVGVNGTVYNDWRLPTLAELDIISNYQYDKNNEVLDEVLKGAYYWSAYNTGSKYGYYGTGNPTDDHSTPIKGFLYTTNNNGNNCHIRCIRDLTPAELTNDK